MNHRRNKLGNLVAVIACTFVLTLASIANGQGNLDLNTWTQQGASSAGNWTVSPDGSNVFQSINGAPTYFVSSEDFLGATFEGRISVETTSDDDFIGFVFGYDTPLGGDPVNDAEYILFDWKQGAQSGAPEGFWLGKVSGTHNGSSGTGNQLWDKVSDTNLTMTSFGSALVNDGWEDNVEYTFELLYFEDSIEIYMQGGNSTFANRTQIYDVDISDLPSGTFSGDLFPSGRFGFYNFSQASVRYTSFTAVIPEPTAIVPITLALLTVVIRRKK